MKHLRQFSFYAFLGRLFLVSLLGAAFVGLAVVRAGWVNPTEPPPESNVAPTINVGFDREDKYRGSLITPGAGSIGANDFWIGKITRWASDLSLGGAGAGSYSVKLGRIPPDGFSYEVCESYNGDPFACKTHNKRGISRSYATSVFWALDWDLDRELDSGKIDGICADENGCEVSILSYSESRHLTPQSDTKASPLFRLFLSQVSADRRFWSSSYRKEVEDESNFYRGRDADNSSRDMIPRVGSCRLMDAEPTTPLTGYRDSGLGLGFHNFVLSSNRRVGDIFCTVVFRD